MFDKIREKLRRRRNEKATIDALSKLTDDELKDIGITRGTIRDVATNVIAVHRAVRDNDGI